MDSTGVLGGVCQGFQCHPSFSGCLGKLPCLLWVGEGRPGLAALEWGGCAETPREGFPVPLTGKSASFP